MSDMIQQMSNHASLLKVLYHFWKQLSARRHRQIVCVVALMWISSFAEILSIGSILPFLGLLVAPEKVWDSSTATYFVHLMHLHSTHNFLLSATILFVFSALASNGIRLLFLWSNTRVSALINADINLEVYRRTLYQPFLVHTARNSSEVVSGLVSKASMACQALQSVLTLMSSILIVIAILWALLLINTEMAIIAALSFGVSYGGITWFFRKRLQANANIMAGESTRVVKALREGLGAIRDVLLDGTQAVYSKLYSEADRPFKLAQGNNNFIGIAPRFGMEALGMILIAGLAYYVSQASGGIAVALPMLGALALGAQRLLPALQQGYAAWAIIVGNDAFLLDTLALLNQPLPEGIEQANPAPLRFQEKICFKNVSFRYTNCNPLVLQGINLSILKGMRVGFVGSTGGGKSTILDLLMGLLEPIEGMITVDRHPLLGINQRAWRRTIAHVPQSIYLADITIAENIAFGVPLNEINMERVKRVASQAQLTAFIENSAKGYQTLVGERGIRLSGGQRQRIGIARALYKQASVLVFDEATSALDNLTEQDVMDAIDGLHKDLTIIIVAHRLSTVKHCDQIFEMVEGHIVAQGSYDELLKKSDSFRKMASVTE